MCSVNLHFVTGPLYNAYTFFFFASILVLDVNLKPEELLENMNQSIVDM